MRGAIFMKLGRAPTTLRIFIFIFFHQSGIQDLQARICSEFAVLSPDDDGLFATFTGLVNFFHDLDELFC